MQDLKTRLKNKLSGAKRIAVLGIGSELLSDDAAGLIVAEKLKNIESKSFKVFLGAASPESLTGEIKRFNPTHIIFIDAADLKTSPGSFEEIDLDKVEGASFSTHRLPTKILADYLILELNCEIIIIGIQPESFIFCEKPSPKVLAGIETLVSLIENIVVKN